MTDIPAVARGIARELGADRLVALPNEVALLRRDMGEPPALFQQLLDATPPTFGVRPRTTEEIALAVRMLAEEGVPITPRGLGSCGFGGAVPVGGGAVLDLSWMRGVDRVDLEARRATVRAGTTFFFIQRELERHLLELQSQPTNALGTIGGWTAAGGLGLGSLGAGAVGEQVAELEVVLPDGGIERLERGDSGFHRVLDTEGQLGIIARLTIDLRERRRGTAVTALVFPDLEGAQRYLVTLLGGDRVPSTVMLVGHSREVEGLEGGPEGEVLLVQDPGAVDLPEAGPGVEVLPRARALRLWNRRFFPMDSPLGPVFLASESVMPAEGVADYVQHARALGRRYGVPLHAHAYAVRRGTRRSVLVLMIFPANPRLGWHHLMLTPLAAVLTSAAVKRGGVPYGVGIWNTPFARMKFGGERFEALQRAKERLDPRGLFNPGKFFSVGRDITALPAAMTPSLYPTSLSLASVTTPLMMRARDPSLPSATTAERCISCGACVPVCPAVVATEAESVAARAKLELVRRLAAGEPVDDEELLGAARCLRCGQCAEVCARRLDLVQAWQELDQGILERVDEGRFRETIRSFADAVDARAGDVLDVALT